MVMLWSYMQDPNERKQAEESLTPFGKSTDYIPHLRVCPRIYLFVFACACSKLTRIAVTLPVRLQTILDNSNNPYAQYFASSSLLKMITEQSVRCAFHRMPTACCVNDVRSDPADQESFRRVEIKLEIRNYFLGYLER